MSLYPDQARRDQIVSLIEHGFTNQATGDALGIGKSCVSMTLQRMREAGVVIVRPARARVDRPYASLTPKTYGNPKHPPMTPVTLFERTGCAFPINDGRPFLFCNNEVHSPTSYCEFHGKLMVRGE